MIRQRKLRLPLAICGAMIAGFAMRNLDFAALFLPRGWRALHSADPRIRGTCARAEVSTDQQRAPFQFWPER